MNAAGLTWKLASVRLAAHEFYQLQGFLFDLRERKAPLDVVVIGDGAFLDRAVGRLPPGKRVMTVNFHRFRIDALSTLLDSVPPGRVGAFVLQHSPLLWSDYRFGGRSQSIDLWRELDGGDLTLFPIKQIRLAFRSLKDMADRPTGWLDDKHGRLGNLDELSFVTQRKELEKIERAIARHKEARFVWITELAGYDQASNPELFREIERFAAAPESRTRFGTLIPLAALPTAF